MTETIIIVLGSIFGLVLSIYWTIRAWNSSPDDWREADRRTRPKSWEKWPIYGALWRDFDRHTSRYLWQSRILGPVGAALFIVLGLLVLIGRLAA